MIGIQISAFILSAFSLGSGLPSLHIAMELISNFGAKNMGDYLRANVMNEAFVPGLLLLKEHYEEDGGNQLTPRSVAGCSYCSLLNYIWLSSCGRIG